MTDPIEGIRRILTPLVNAVEGEIPGWNTEELRRDFTVEGFMAPFVVVTRKSDGVRGSLMFRHNPRVYFDFTPYEK